MKSTLLSLLLSVTLFGCKENDTHFSNYYWSNGEKIGLTAINKCYLLFQSKDLSAVIEALNKKGVINVSDVFEYDLRGIGFSGDVLRYFPLAVF